MTAKKLKVPHTFIILLALILFVGILTYFVPAGSYERYYDPETGRYVSYGEVINHYFAKITEMLADGSSPEEIEKALSAYYTALYDGSKKEN